LQVNDNNEEVHDDDKSNILLSYPEDFNDNDEEAHAKLFASLVHLLEQGNHPLKNADLSLFQPPVEGDEHGVIDKWIGQEQMQELYTLWHAQRSGLGFALSNCLQFVGNVNGYSGVQGG